MNTLKRILNGAIQVFGDTNIMILAITNIYQLLWRLICHLEVRVVPFHAASTLQLGTLVGKPLEGWPEAGYHQHHQVALLNHTSSAVRANVHRAYQHLDKMEYDLNSTSALCTDKRNLRQQSKLKNSTLLIKITLQHLQKVFLKGERRERRGRGREREGRRGRDNREKPETLHTSEFQ